MTVFVILAFAGCWTPYFVISMIRIYSDYRVRLKWPLVLAELVGLLHSAINPVVYVAYSSTAIGRIFRSGRFRRRRRSARADSHMEIATFRATSASNAQLNASVVRRKGSCVGSVHSINTTQHGFPADLVNVAGSCDTECARDRVLCQFRHVTCNVHKRTTNSPCVRERNSNSLRVGDPGMERLRDVRSRSRHVVERVSTM